MCSIFFYVTIASILIRAKREIEKEKDLDRKFKLSYACVLDKVDFELFLKILCIFVRMKYHSNNM